MSHSFELTGQQLDDLFPCYLLTNTRLELQGVGPSLTRLLPGAIAGAALESLFVVERPIRGLDPATASAPFVATLVDVTGRIIYFSVATAVLSGTLL